jgi:hypothetical protein
MKFLRTKEFLKVQIKYFKKQLAQKGRKVLQGAMNFLDERPKFFKEKTFITKQCTFPKEGPKSFNKKGSFPKEQYTFVEEKPKFSLEQSCFELFSNHNHLMFVFI